MVLFGCICFALFFTTVIYPDLEYKGYSSNQSCTGMCYANYVEENGTVVEQLRAKQELANLDEFSDIRSLWSGCAACHGKQGQGQGMFPMLAGQSKDYISGRLISYKNREKVGMNSSMMWGQATNLSTKEIELIGEFVEANFPRDGSLIPRGLSMLIVGASNASDNISCKLPVRL